MDPKKAAKVANTANEGARLLKGDGTKSKVPVKVREENALAMGVRETTPEVEKTLRAIVALQIAGFSQPEIDQLLHKNTKFTSMFIDRLRPEWRVQKQAHIDACVERFYDQKISILERIMTAAPQTVEYWIGVLEDKESTKSQRSQACKEIREWTSLIMRSDKHSQASRDLLSGEEQATAEKGLEMEQRMQKLIRRGAKAVGDDPN
jgi:hypothetical protein